MDQDTSALATAIGLRVKHERQARSWTLDRLAEAAGVSRRMLVNVEQATANPSVGTLLRISEALGVGLPALVEPPTPELVKVTRRGEGAVLWSSDAGGRGILVAGTESPDVVELWDWVLEPGDAHRSDGHPAGTKELVQVHEGVVTLEVADQAYALGAGDAVSFSGSVAHAYSNAEKGRARFSLAVFDPAQDPRRGDTVGHRQPES